MAEDEYRCATCGEYGDGNLHNNPEHDADHKFDPLHPEDYVDPDDDYGSDDSSDYEDYGSDDSSNDESSDD